MEARIAALMDYAELIARRRKNPPTEADGYCELHHGLPKSMGGGEGDNLVLLPVREHIEAHQHLARAIGDQTWGKGMAFAMFTMLGGRRTKHLTLDEAAEARELMAAAVSGDKNPAKRPEVRAKIAAAARGKSPSQDTRARMSAARVGRTLSDETCQKLALAQAATWNDERRATLAERNSSQEMRDAASRANKGKTVSEETRRKLSLANLGKQTWLGRSHSAESRARMSEAQKKKPPISDETRERMAEASRGRTHSDEARAKIGAGNRGKTVSEESRRRIAASWTPERRAAQAERNRLRREQGSQVRRPPGGPDL